LLTSELFLTVSIWINNIVKQQGNHTMNELDKLFKALTTLTNLAIIYLFIRWSYEGLDFILRSILS